MAVGNLSHAKVGVSINKESTYGSKIPSARLLTMGSSYTPIVPVVTQFTNLSMTTGTELPTAAYLGPYHYQGQLVWDLVKADDLAWALAFILGAPTTTSNYKHDYSAIDTDHVIPSFTIEESYYDAAAKFECAGAVLQNLNINFAVGSAATMSAGFLTKTRESDANAVDGTLAASQPCCTGQQIKIYIASHVMQSYVAAQNGEELEGTATEITSYVRSISIGISNGTDPTNLLTFASQTLGRAERSLRDITLSMTIEADATNIVPLLAYPYTESSNELTYKAIEIEWYTGVTAGSNKFGAQFVFPKVSFQAPTFSRDGATGKLLAEFPLTVHYEDNSTYDVGGNDFGPMRATVWNTVASYAGT